MSKRSGFAQIRKELDDAITYSSKLNALKIAKKALILAQNKKNNSEIEYFKGQIKLIKNDYISAIEHFDRAIKINPNDGASYNDRALCMVEIGIIDGAFIYFDKGIEVEPDYATIYHNKGWLLNNIGRYKEAIECFNKALELEPKRAVTYDNLADAFFNLNNYKGAVESYRKVLKLLKANQGWGVRKQIHKRIKEINFIIAKNKKVITK